MVGKNEFNRVELLLRIIAIKGIKYSYKEKLLQHLQRESDWTSSRLKALSLSDNQIAQFYSVSQAEIDEVDQWLSNPEHHLITLYDPAYPPQLKECFHPPLALYVMGDPRVLSEPQLAIVGSRLSSYYGRRWAKSFSQQLAQSGVVITSGLALGIDSEAHRGALVHQQKTVAVLGSGLLRLYPKQNRKLAQEIIAYGGVVMSEFPLTMPPLASNFPQRNRIISGLSLGTLVIEATLKSGSLITARFALEQNRNVYALPGAVGKPESEGCHWLIQQGAMLVNSPLEILEDLKINHLSLSINQDLQPNLRGKETEPLPFPELLANVEDEVTPVDVVAERTGLSVSEVSAALIELELAGWVAAVPGGYVRIRRAGHVRRSNLFI